MHIVYARTLNGKSIPVHTDGNTRVGAVKHAVQNESGYSASDINIVYNGKVLSDNTSLNEITIKNGTSISIVPKL